MKLTSCDMTSLVYLKQPQAGALGRFFFLFWHMQMLLFSKNVWFDEVRGEGYMNAHQITLSNLCNSLFQCHSWLCSSSGLGPLHRVETWLMTKRIAEVNKVTQSEGNIYCVNTRHQFCINKTMSTQAHTQ